MKTLLLISHSSNMTGGSEDEFQKLLIYLSGKYKIYTIFPKGYRSEIFKKYSDKFLEIDLRLFPFTKFRFKEYLGYFRRNFKKIIAIYKFIKNNNDINLCFVNSSVCLIEIIAIVLSRKPYLLSVKEKINPFLPRKIIYYFYGQTALKILTISKFLQNEIEIHTKRKDIEIIYSTIDENSFEQMTKQFVSKRNDKNFKILNIGSIYPLKGQHVLIKVLSRLKDQNISVEFVGRIVDKEYFSEINKSVNNFVLSNVITFLGELNKKDLVKKILESDCIVITSKEEGQSLVILEALFIEKPIITTKVGITNEIIKNNFNGLLYDFNDVDTLCNLILKLKNDNIFYNFIKSNCKNTYIYNFNSEVTMEQYEKIISMS